MDEETIEKRLLENEFLALKLGIKVEKDISTESKNFKFSVKDKIYKIRGRKCNILETILFDVQNGTGNWVKDVANELGIEECLLGKIKVKS
ncbi:MAG: hypothetical protein WCJ72_01875 [Chryseobacterium sp.]|jgi:hypothetical protein